MNRISIVDCTSKNTLNIDYLIKAFSSYFEKHHIETLVVSIKSLRVVDCTDCKVCMQTPGDGPSKCFHRDGMDDIIDILEISDGYIFISDTYTMFNLNEILQKFTKRLAAYYYWPYGSKCSVNRKTVFDKNSIIINLNGTKGLIQKANYDSLKQLKMNSMAIGAEPISSLSLKPSKNIEKFEKKYLEIIKSNAKNLIQSL